LNFLFNKCAEDCFYQSFNMYSCPSLLKSRQTFCLPVLGLVDGIVVVDAGLLLDDLRLGAAAGHGAAEEDVDEEHDAEEHTECDAEVGQPVGVG
jgi:hypothetical protein